MEGNCADMFSSRDNLYPNNSSLVSKDIQSAPYSPHSDPYYPFDIQLDSFEFSLNSSGLLWDSSALPIEIQSVASSALPYIFEPEIPSTRNQYPPGPWDYQPQAHDPHWNLSTMNDIIPGHHNTVQDIDQAFPDENEAPNTIIHGSPERQLETHSRTYVCNHKPCSRKSFSNKSGLERHKREVHGSQQFTCPIPSCNRSRQGFHRRYNLFEHQKRVHGPQSSNSPRTPNTNSDDLFESDGTTPSPPYEAESNDVNRTVGVTGAGSSTREEFEIKLRRLRAMRQELNKDIKSMERVLSIMGGEY